MDILKHFFQLIRWKNIGIIAITQVAAYVCLNSFACFNIIFSCDFVHVLLSTLIIAAAGYMINDYSDMKIDVINKPDKLIVGRYFSPRWVLVLYIIFNVFALYFALHVSLKYFLLCIVIILLLRRYSTTYKYHFVFGNLLVSFFLALTLIVIYFAEPAILPDWLLFYSFFAFFTGVIREIVKDIEDMEGDEAYGAKTIPNTVGLVKTKYIILYLTLLTMAILIVSIGYLFIKGYMVLPVYLIATVFFPFIYTLVKLQRADTKPQFHHISRLVKLLMIAGIISMPLRCLNNLF